MLISGVLEHGRRARRATSFETHRAKTAAETSRKRVGAKCFSAYLSKLTYQYWKRIAEARLPAECPPSWAARTSGRYRISNPASFIRLQKSTSSNQIG